MMDIIDCHSHDVNAASAIIAVDPRQFDPQPGKYYSVGYHPWHDVAALTDDDFALLERCAAHPQVLAVGETGMDALRGADLDVQARVFVRHLQIAATVGKPVIAHNVRTTQQILAARWSAGLGHVALVIHGMRGNGHVARTLLDAGCYLSYGSRFNAAAVLATPLDRLLIETDDGPVGIHDVATTVASALHLTTDEILGITAGNIRALMGLREG